MRKITEIIIHCTATPRGQHVTVEQIRACHMMQNGWNDIGYHHVVYLDGTIHPGRPETIAGAHCLGHNSQSVGVAYVGGVEADGRPADTRTPEQKRSLKMLVGSLLEKYPGATVHGHNEFAAKACPSFNVAAEFGKKLAGIMMAIILSGLVTGCGTARKSVETHEEYNDKFVVSITDRQRFTDQLLEVADLTVSIDSVVIERKEKDDRPSERLKTGPVMLKLTRKRVVDVMAETESEAETYKMTEARSQISTKKEISNKGLPMSHIILITLFFVAAGWIVWKFCRKKW